MNILVLFLILEEMLSVFGIESMHVYVGDDGNDGFSSRQGGQEKPERVIFK